MKQTARFQTRIAGKLTTPKREPSPLGRVRNVRLFRAVYAHLTAPDAESTPARRFEAVERFLASTEHLPPADGKKPSHGRFEAIQRFLRPTMRDAGWRFVGAVPASHPQPAISIFHERKTAP